MKTILAAALAVGALLTAAPANADDTQLVYLQLLNMRGLSVYNTALALAGGYQACEQLNYDTGDVVIPWMVNHYWDLNYQQASTVVYTAVEVLCPWHDRSGTQI